MSDTETDTPQWELPRKRTVPPEEQPVPRLWGHDAFEAIERTDMEVDGDGD